MLFITCIVFVAHYGNLASQNSSIAQVHFDPFSTIKIPLPRSSKPSKAGNPITYPTIS